MTSTGLAPWSGQSAFPMMVRRLMSRFSYISGWRKAARSAVTGHADKVSPQTMAPPNVADPGWRQTGIFLELFLRRDDRNKIIGHRRDNRLRTSIPANWKQPKTGGQ